jgi:Ca-activated chloride channel family protein
MMQRRRQWRGLRFFVLSMSLSFLVIAIAGPQWGREPLQPGDPGRDLAHGRDLVVVLDLSRSMLAEDVLPSRLKHAQKAIEELLANLRERGGHRIALVGFAGRSRVVCPLTNDYDHFVEKLLELDPAHLPPELRAGVDAASGTRIGAALELAVEAHDSRFRGSGVQDILLLSDGDDPGGDNEWFAGILAAQSAGIPVFTVGIGDPVEGRPVPAGERGFFQHKGKVVTTRLVERPLQEIAQQTKGTYTAARTGVVPLVDLFRNTIEQSAKREAVDAPLPLYRQRYPWFFAAAFLLLALEMTTFRSTQGRKSQAPAKEQKLKPTGSAKPQEAS